MGVVYISASKCTMQKCHSAIDAKSNKITTTMSEHLLKTIKKNNLKTMVLMSYSALVFHRSKTTRRKSAGPFIIPIQDRLDVRYLHSQELTIKTKIRQRLLASLTF